MKKDQEILEKDWKKIILTFMWKFWWIFKKIIVSEKFNIILENFVIETLIINLQAILKNFTNYGSGYGKLLRNFSEFGKIFK